MSTHTEGGKIQTTKPTCSEDPPAQNSTVMQVVFVFFVFLLGERVCIHQAIWVYATSSRCTLVLQLKIEPGVVEQTVPV